MKKKLKTALLTLLIMLISLVFIGLCILTKGMLLIIITFTLVCYLFASVIVDAKEIEKKRKKDFNHENH